MAPDGRAVFYTMVWSGIWVNAAGERFMNERLPYDRAGHEILRVQAETGVSTLPTYWVFDQRQVDRNAFDMLPVDPPVPGWFDVEPWIEAGALVRADTLEELAEQIGVPAGALSKSVEQFNEFAVSGVDEQFHRGETPWDRVDGAALRSPRGRAEPLPRRDRPGRRTTRCGSSSPTSARRAGSSPTPTPGCCAPTAR